MFGIIHFELFFFLKEYRENSCVRSGEHDLTEDRAGGGAAFLEKVENLMNEARKL